MKIVIDEKVKIENYDSKRGPVCRVFFFGGDFRGIANPTNIKDGEYTKAEFLAKPQNSEYGGNAKPESLLSVNGTK